ncbi:MAG: divalent-cation tolerance protein CutA [Saprospiraceae bacterium]|nr:divalent-cation tolerance protein CutA [Saprospiraceae bacterium]
MGFLLFYVTFPNEHEAKQLSDRLLNDKIIACANIFPVNSSFWWQGQLSNENEWVALYKTSILNETKLQNFIQDHHPYEIPCIMRFEVRANEKYENWVNDNTQI